MTADLMVYWWAASRAANWAECSAARKESGLAAQKAVKMVVLMVEHLDG